MIKRIIFSFTVVFSLIFSSMLVEASTNVCGNLGKNVVYLEESKNIPLDKEWDIEFTSIISPKNVLDSVFICDEDGFEVKDLFINVKGKNANVKNKYIYKENKSYSLIIKNIANKTYIKRFSTGSIELNDNVKILFYNEDEGFYNNINNQKVSLKKPEAKNEVEKAKVSAKFYISKHLNSLSEKGVDVDKMLKDKPLYVEIFPYAVPNYAGWFQGKNITYLPPTPELGNIKSDEDKLVFVTFNPRNEISYTFNGRNMEDVLIHEFGHYIAHNYFNHNDYMHFLEIKDLHNTEIANNIYRMDVEWNMRPSEIFAENYVDIFLENHINQTVKLTNAEKIKLEKWLFNKIR